MLDSGPPGPELDLTGSAVLDCPCTPPPFKGSCYSKAPAEIVVAAAAVVD